MKKLHLLCAAALAAASLGALPAMAYDYNFTGPTSDDYYQSTNYEEVYGSRYNYGGLNAADYAVTPELPGYHSAIQVQQPMVSTGSTPQTYPQNSTPNVWEGTTIPPTVQTAFTDAGTLKRSDGSIGTLKIPALGISYKAYEGATSTSMSKGVAHYASTSGWDGNIGLCGHNRGSSHNIGSIKDLSIGDKITYTTSLGTRTYKVKVIVKIANDDWSYLGETSDNRVTITTCAANQPEYRWCVQAVQE